LNASTTVKHLDMLGQEINVGDFVVYTNNIYRVLVLGKYQIKGKLVNPSPSTRNKVFSKHECIVLDDLLVVNYINSLV
jgi:hypothetical protein